MILAPILPVWLIALLAGAAALAAWRCYRTPSWPAVLRLAALALLVLLACEPMLDSAAPHGDLPRIAVVVDASGSMAHTDADGSRHAAALAIAAALEGGIGGGARSERYSLSETLVPGTAAPGGGTDFAPLAGFAAGPAPAGVVLISDGADRGQSAPDGALAAAGIPVFCIAVGGEAPPDNAAVRLEAAAPTAFAGQEVLLTAVATADGACLGQPARITILDEDGAELVRREVTLARETRCELAVPAGDRSASRRWLARLDAPPGEATLDDNRSSAAVRVVDRRIAIAVVEGSPWWDTAAMLRALRRDRQFSVAAIHRLGSRAFRSGDAAAGPDTASIAAADVVVLGLDAGDLLPAGLRAAIVERIDAGGGLLLVGVHAGLGPPLAALDPLLRLPGRSDSVHPTVAPGAARFALLPAGGDPLPAVSAGRVAGVRPLAEILLGDGTLPLAALRRFGAGRVATLNAEGIWRWTMAGRGEDADRLWRQLVRMVGGNGGGLVADRARWRPGQQAVVAVPAGCQGLHVADPAGAVQDLPVRDGAVRIPLDRAGIWRATAGSEAIELIVEPDCAEVAGAVRDEARLRRLADATGGRLAAAGEAPALGRTLAARAGLLAAAPPPRPLVPGSLAILLPLALLAAEWWLRRRRHGAL